MVGGTLVGDFIDGESGLDGKLRGLGTTFIEGDPGGLGRAQMENCEG